MLQFPGAANPRATGGDQREPGNRAAFVAQQPVGRQTNSQAAAAADETPGAAVVAEAVRRNGPIFIEWPAPRYALVFTGDLTGYIEPCGCAGLENLKGGLSRRSTLLSKLKQQGWPAAAFDLGGQVRRIGVQQTEIKFQQTVKGLIEMGYAAIGFGADDLRMPATALLGAATEPYLDKTAPFTSANVALFGFDSGATARFRTVNVGGKKIGVTAIVGDSFTRTITNEGVVIVPAEQGLKEVLAELTAERCDELILLSYALPEETETLVKKFPQFRFVVTAGGADEPPGNIRLVAGTQTGLIEVGKKGQHAIVVGIYDDAAAPIRYQRVPLDARFPESSDMKRLLTEYQDQLRVAGLANLGVTEKIHPRAEATDPRSAQFVGSESCAKCHQGAFDVWKDSGHAHATATLAELKPARQFDPECISCHAVGWDPQQHVPFQSGFLDLVKTPQLVGNGCENCHGPGGAHVQAETGPDAARRAELRLLMKAALATAERNLCAKCHDHDNSPEFKFDAYWEQIKH
ncbi:MAG: hypothetical protein K8U03_26535 [Planctomycetia bacterium]|nr:hypothetical protein [Planctomycetia bacterium]